MKDFISVSNEIEQAVSQLEPWLLSLTEELVSTKRNSQNRTIRQVLGHMHDSASNNTHRVIHLQYQTSPVNFPDYAHFGNNDRWIAIQNYQQEDWYQLVKLWKYANLHFCHVIRQINPDKLQQVWVSALNEEITLEIMVNDYPRHFKLHVGEIKELAGESSGL
jgi:hypothetical protein